MNNVDYEHPPLGYLVWFDDAWACVCWGLEDDGQALNDPDDNLTEAEAIAAAWDHFRRTGPRV